MSPDTGPAAMAGWTAPTLADIECLAEAAFAALPNAFRALARDVVILVDDFPSDEVLDTLGAETEFDLLGLFTGVGLAQAGVGFDGGLTMTGQMPNTVHLYRRPILDYWAEHEESLGHLVTHVLVHEIGHHVGLSDEDIEAIEVRTRDGEGDGA